MEEEDQLVETVQGKKAKKSKSGSGRGERAQNQYMLFCECNRSLVTDANADVVNNRDISSVLSQKWLARLSFGQREQYRHLSLRLAKIKDDQKWAEAKSEALRHMPTVAHHARRERTRLHMTDAQIKKFAPREATRHTNTDQDKIPRYKLVRLIIKDLLQREDVFALGKCSRGDNTSASFISYMFSFSIFDYRSETKRISWSK